MHSIAKPSLKIRTASMKLKIPVFVDPQSVCSVKLSSFADAQYSLA